MATVSHEDTVTRSSSVLYYIFRFLRRLIFFSLIAETFTEQSRCFGLCAAASFNHPT